MQCKPYFSRQTFVYPGVKAKDECFISLQGERDKDSGLYKLNDKEVKGDASHHINRTTLHSRISCMFCLKTPDVLSSAWKNMKVSFNFQLHYVFHYLENL